MGHAETTCSSAERIYLHAIHRVCCRWLALWLDMCSLSLLAVACFGSVALRHTLNPGLVGLSLSYLMQMTGLVQWLVRQVGDCAVVMHVCGPLAPRAALAPLACARSFRLCSIIPLTLQP